MIPHINDSKEELVESEIFYAYEKINNIKWYDRILLNRPLKVVLVFILTSIVAPLVIYRYCFFTSLNLPPPDGFSVGSCLIPRAIRLPCGVGYMTQEECHTHCCYDLNTKFCFHRIPSRFSYIMTQPWNEQVVLQPRVATVPYANQNSVPTLKLSIDEVSATHMSLTFYNSKDLLLNGKRLYNKEYTYEVSSPETNVIVNASQGTIFNTARGPFIASDNIWEITFRLTNETMFGLGELPLRRNVTKMIYSHEQGYSSIPLIFAKLNNSFHGLLIDMKEPTEVHVQSSDQIVVRSITNFGFKFHIFVGPEPKNIMEDVMKVIGYNKKLEYWMLGIHICSELSEMDLASFISNASRLRMPYDSHCGHGPVVFNSDQCGSSNTSNIELVNAGANLVRNARKKFVPHVSPYIRYLKQVNETNKEDNSTETAFVERCKILPTYKDIMYRDPNTLELYKGKIDDLDVIYPNFGRAHDDFLDDLWAYTNSFDGLVLVNNWPLDRSEKNFSEISNYLPYFNENFEGAFRNTPQWNLTLVNNSEPYLFHHNVYGNNFAEAFAKKANTTPIWSSSVWMNGSFAVNRQNIDPSWTNLRRELVAAALGGISGHWLWSSPVCGDTENFNHTTQSDLCVKWYMAATYFPMIKINSKEIDRHPLAFNGTNRNLIINALNHRLGFLPYFYTTLQEGPLLRPMFYQFPSSESLHNLSSQFSVGDILLIAPNLTPHQTHVHVWLPPGTWYELWSGLKLQGNEGDPVTLTTSQADFLTFIQGGSILIYQRNAQLTAEDTQFLIPFSTIIALECNKTVCQASGKQFITKKMNLIFEANASNLTITADGADFDPICDFSTGIWAYDIEFIRIYGLPDDENNFDHYREFRTFVDLCLLERQDRIVVNLLS